MIDFDKHKGIMMKKSISNDILLDELKKLAKKINRTPSQNDMIRHGNNITKLLHMYRRRFGSFQNAQIRAGLAKNKSGRELKYTDVELLDELRNIGNKLSKTPSQNDIKMYSKYPVGAFKRRFGTYNKAVKKAGLKPNTNSRLYVKNKSINKNEIERNLKKRKKPWDGSPIDFPLTNNISTSLTCPLDTLIVWRGEELSSKYLRSIDEDLRDEIVKDLLNFFLKYDFTSLRYSNISYSKDLKFLLQKNAILKEDSIPNNLNYGTRICKTYFPHILELKTRKKDSVLKVVTDKEMLFKVLRNRVGNTFLDGPEKRQHPFNITPAMILQGAKSTGFAAHGSVFKPSVAKTIYKHWVKDGDIVYDYSSGYGGRLLGFYASGVKAKYIGTDVEPDTYKSLKKMTKDFNIDADIYNNGSETFIPPCKINFAFSSPPYFNHELYSDHPNQSAIKFNYYEKWLEEYWRITVRNIRKALADDGVLAINAGNSSNKKMIEINNDMNRVIKEEGFKLYCNWYMTTHRSHFSKTKVPKKEPICFYKKL